MIRLPPRSTLSSSSAASDVYKRQGGALHGLEEVETELAAIHAFPKGPEGLGRGRQQHRIDDLEPYREGPDDDQAGDADNRQKRVEALHPLRTSRWNTSRQCALTRINSGSDKLASVRGRASS